MRAHSVLKALTLLGFGAMGFGTAGAEDLTLALCEAKALANHPLTAVTPLIDQTERAGRDSASFQYLPRLSVSGKATRPSEVTSVTSPIISIQGELNQWQMSADASQLLFDGGAIKAQKKSIAAGAEIERRQLAVNLESLRSQVRQTFFTVILLDSQIAQNRLLAQELADNRVKRMANLANGIGIQSDIDEIRVEELKTAAKNAELNAARDAAVYALSRLSGSTFAPDSRFIRPVIATPDDLRISESRKELALYRAREAASEAERASLAAGLLPKVSAFAQWGEGNPGLNMLQSGLSDWWLVGIRGTLTLDNLYGFKAGLRRIDAAVGKLEAERAAFLLAEEVKLRQKLAEIDRLEKTIAIDERTILLRASMKAAAQAKAENGVIAMTDLVREISSESLAKETKILHEIQLLATRSDLNLIIGYGDTQP